MNLEELGRIVKRREQVHREAPRCSACDSDQMQLLEIQSPPYCGLIKNSYFRAKWRCRICHNDMMTTHFRPSEDP